jgi:predicted lipoprotein with Yx(FWY)xxD motif
LYLFTRDEGSTSTCTGGCAQAWPPLLASQVHLELAGEGVQADLLGTIAQPDGSSQVTYNAHPLYNFSGDQEAGHARGQATGDVWFVVSPTGEAVTSVSPTGDAGTTSY